MVPTHLTLPQLSKILLESNVTFKPRFSSHHSQPKESLAELYGEFSEDLKTKELYNGIIDLEYEVNQLLNI